jgi:acyl-CoA thioesterase-1
MRILSPSRVRRLQSGILVWCVALLCGCADPQLSPLPPGAAILAFGDSLTAGVGAAPAESYPAELARLSSLQVINAGVSGETTFGGVQRLPAALAEHTPDLLILLQGGNDILRGKDLAATRENLAAMIEQAQAAQVQVVLVGVPDKLLFTDSAAFYGELAEQYQVVLVEDALAGLLRNTAYKSDAIHLNARGYALFAQAVYETLQEQGAL